jgi:hypothetical protein
MLRAAKQNRAGAVAYWVDLPRKALFLGISTTSIFLRFLLVKIGLKFGSCSLASSGTNVKVCASCDAMLVTLPVVWIVWQCGTVVVCWPGMPLQHS